MNTQQVSLTDHMNRLKSLIEKNEDNEAKNLFREIYVLHDYRTGNRKVATFECGSFPLETATALYRLLFLSAPGAVDFSDMYKSNSLFALCSPDGKFVADFQFYKYELAAYCSAAKEHVTGSPHAVQSGMPGSDNGIKAVSPELTQWMELLKACLSRKWMIYGGNDFEV